MLKSRAPAMKRSRSIDRQRAGGDGLSADFPVLLWADDEIAGIQRQRDFLRKVEPDPPARAGAVLRLDEDLRPREIERPPIGDALVLRPSVDAEPRRDIVLLHREHNLGGSERCAAPPSAQQPGVAGLSAVVVVDGAAEQDRILVQPVDPGLGLRQEEAVSHETLGRKVEFADLDRVGAVERQADQRAAVVGRFRRAGEGPGDALGGVQRVDVEQQLPFRRIGAIAFERGSPPQPARMRGVLPEIVEMIAGFADERNPVVRIQDRQRRVEIGAIGRVAKLRVGAGVLRIDPGDRARRLRSVRARASDRRGRRRGCAADSSDCPKGSAGRPIGR